MSRLFSALFSRLNLSRRHAGRKQQRPRARRDEAYFASLGDTTDQDPVLQEQLITIV